ncbi:uncharacterized protein MYCFIDRAFT_176649 [Pseudocercospora fijiensis CIRAD86]|uniref:Uncharacterized protein n=1 Tax=Pseudocercospora fijiensis (strain CIRAD86) TaxID=383855 RepID=M3AW65_PSEFD|nr:uncharacterized protein MYCFIDRAFT_176649 [Pseudocercospora fijiensis CIRAD86]EME81368.1 hypothetical protein MYCFIDRAFT_176649 [Pseudocercospora fijiensis CIRAD86]
MKVREQCQLREESLTAYSLVNSAIRITPAALPNTKLGLHSERGLLYCSKPWQSIPCLPAGLAPEDRRSFPDEKDEAYCSLICFALHRICIYCGWHSLDLIACECSVHLTTTLNTSFQSAYPRPYTTSETLITISMTGQRFLGFLPKKDKNPAEVLKDTTNTRQLPPNQLYIPATTPSDLTLGKENNVHSQQAPSTKEQNQEDDGFIRPKHQQRKFDQKVHEEKLTAAYDHDAKIRNGHRNMDGDWGREREKTQGAKNMIQEAQVKHQQLALKRATHTHKLKRNEQSTKTSFIGRYGTKSTVAAPLRTALHQVLFSDQVPGLIVRHTDTFPLPAGSTKKEGDPGVWKDRNGVLQEDKARTFIIDTRHVRRVKECRVLTHGDTGLAKVPKNEWVEHLNLMPYSAKEEDYTPQNPNAPILKVEYKTGRGALDRKTMVIRLSDPVIRDVDCDDLEKIGALTGESLRVLQDSLRKLEEKITWQVSMTAFGVFEFLDLDNA